MIDAILRFFSPDAEIRFLRNQAAHVISSYGAAKARIADAQRKFETIRENTIAEFEETKKSTYERTREAVARIKDNAEVEREDIIAAADEAVAKCDAKCDNADLLLRQVEALNRDEHAL